MKTCLIEVVQNNILTRDEAKASHFEGLKKCADSNLSYDLMFINFILLHEGPNLNGDYFTRDEMVSMWHTFVGKPITWEHGQPYIGYITDAKLVSPNEDDLDNRWFIECAGIIWKARYPEEAERIQQGAVDGSYKVSMEVYFNDVLYKVGEKLYTYEEAPFLEVLRGRKYEGEPVYRVLIGCLGGGAGIVANPADVDALILNVANRNFDKKQNEDIIINNEQNSAYIAVSNMGGIDIVDDFVVQEDLQEEVEKVEELQKKFDELQAKYDELQSELERLKEVEVQCEELRSQLESLAEENQLLEQGKKELESELESIKAECESVKAEYDEYKRQIEAEKIEAEKEALAKARMRELVEGGVVVSEEKWLARLKEMDEEVYADFKEMLLASVEESVKKASDKQQTVASVDDEGVSTVIGLNFEVSNPSQDEVYKNLWEKILKAE